MLPKPVPNLLLLYLEPSVSNRSLCDNIFIALLEQIICIPLLLC